MKKGDNKIPYDVHPSVALQKLFEKKPYQGQDPQKAKVLIIGNDANYTAEIEDYDFFNCISEYHYDGVNFWQQHGKHHPFLLDENPFDLTKGGVPYHKRFSRMRFSSEYAEYFSFVELLNVPTVGNTGENRDLFYELLCPDHLCWLESLLLHGEKKFVLVNQTLAKSIRRINNEYGIFGALVEALDGSQVPSIALDNENLLLYNGYSFSYPAPAAYLYNLSNIIQQFLQKHIHNDNRMRDGK